MHALLVCKIFGLKIRSCKMFDKSHVWKQRDLQYKWKYKVHCTLISFQTVDLLLNWLIYNQKITKLLIFDTFKLLIREKNIAKYAFLRCKTFSLKIWLCKILDKCHVCRKYATGIEVMPLPIGYSFSDWIIEQDLIKIHNF